MLNKLTDNNSQLPGKVNIVMFFNTFIVLGFLGILGIPVSQFRMIGANLIIMVAVQAERTTMTILSRSFSNIDSNSEIIDSIWLLSFRQCPKTCPSTQSRVISLSSLHTNIKVYLMYCHERHITHYYLEH